MLVSATKSFLSSVCIINRLILHYNSIIIVIIIFRQFKEVGAVAGIGTALLESLARHQQLFGRVCAVQRRKTVAARTDSCDDTLGTAGTGREEEPLRAQGK